MHNFVDQLPFHAKVQAGQFYSPSFRILPLSNLNFSRVITGDFL